MSIIAPVEWGRVTGQADTIAIVGSGPSLAAFDMQQLIELQRSHQAYIIAVNGAVDSTPFADAWFTLDPHDLNDRIKPIQGNKWYAAIPDSFGTRFSPIESHKPAPPVGVTYLHRLVGNGQFASKYRLCEDTSAIFTGNSAWGALGVAYHMRPKRILLLGVDGTRGYFYGSTQPSGCLGHLPELFATAVPQLQDRGIITLNGSADSTVTCFPRMNPDAALTAIRTMASGL